MVDAGEHSPAPSELAQVELAHCVERLSPSVSYLAARGLPLACEVNLDPPNPAGQAFHARLGFQPVGEAMDPRNGKRVRYLLRG